MTTRFAQWALMATLAAAPAAFATTHSYSFSGTLGSVDPLASGFPAALADLPADSPYTAVLSFEPTSAPAANPFGGIFAQATLYKPASFTFSFSVGGVTLDDWTDRFGLHVFVWNDEITVGSTQNDGVLFMNIGSPGDTMFQFGNLLYGMSTLASDAMPSATIPGGFALELGQSPLNSRWVTTGGQDLVFAAVPEPFSPALWVAGVLALMAARGLRRGALR